MIRRLASAVYWAAVHIRVFLDAERRCDQTRACAEDTLATIDRDPEGEHR